MQQKVTLKLKPLEALDNATIRLMVAQSIGKTIDDISGFYILKKSIDARSRQQIWANLTVQAFINEPFHERAIEKIFLRDVHSARKSVIIIGGGPAGLFAALELIEQGIKPIVLERGKDVKARRRDLAALNKEGIVNPESNYCFGEGGAGTYSDGKLYTRSNKRGSIQKALNIFVQFGAEEKILYDAHPHIGTNKLPQIITAMREQIIACGGEFHFEKKMVDFSVEKNKIKIVKTEDGGSFSANAVILATGHSARDIFELLYQKNILIEAKSFALGVRVEHPQQLINQIQYHCSPFTDIQSEGLAPASYGWVEQVNDRGVFSFCMCPGGIIAPAATAPGELVVNGWSPSKRNNPFANSGIVVEVGLKDIVENAQWATGKTEMSDLRKSFASRFSGFTNKINSPLVLMYFQQYIEQQAFIAGGGHFVAPAARLADFCENKTSSSLPDCSYLPGVSSADMKTALPNFVHKTLQEGFKAFGKKMRGYYTNDAIVVATESRTSSPVRIPRDGETLEHPQIENLYPCGEGAGYAGGIISAAMDGMNVAAMIANKLEGKV